MAKLNEGRSSSSLARRCIGREHALLFAETGAKVVVNDSAARWTAAARDVGPALAVVDEIKAMGGEAVAKATTCRTTKCGR